MLAGNPQEGPRCSWPQGSGHQAAQGRGHAGSGVLALLDTSRVTPTHNQPGLLSSLMSMKVTEQSRTYLGPAGPEHAWSPQAPCSLTPDLPPAGSLELISTAANHSNAAIRKMVSGGLLEGV